MNGLDMCEIYDSVESMIGRLVDMGLDQDQYIKLGIDRLLAAMNNSEALIASDYLNVTNADNSSESNGLYGSKGGSSEKEIVEESEFIDMINDVIPIIEDYTDHIVLRKDSGIPILVAPSDIAERYRDINSQDCSIDKAREIAEYIVKNHDPRKSLNSQIESSCRQMVDNNLLMLSNLF